MKVVSWNIAHRRSRLQQQLDYLLNLGPHLLALQEVTPAIAAEIRARLEPRGFTVVDSHPLAARRIAGARRSYGVLLASTGSVSEVPLRGQVPWEEKVMAARLPWSNGSLEVTNAYIPPGSSNGWIKIESIEGTVAHMQSGTGHRLLLGDFNSPQVELSDGGIVTWAQQVNADGSIRTRRRFRGGDAARWDAAERSLFESLAASGLCDGFRRQHGYDVTAYSWIIMNRGREFTRRFDHVFTTTGVSACHYDRAPVDAGLSDHCPLIVTLEAD